MNQLVLPGITDGIPNESGIRKDRIKIVNLNIRNPSLLRAKRQAEWIIQTDADIIILTEAKKSEGCIFLCNRLRSYGFDVFFPQHLEPYAGDYCVIIAGRGFASQRLDMVLDFLPHRAPAIEYETALGKLRILGLYVPSRGPKERRNVDKKKFQERIADMLCHHLFTEYKGSTIIAGDLNAIERNHVPHYSLFGEWEYSFYETFAQHQFIDAYRLVHPTDLDYSWFGRKQWGYRFDHFFVSSDLTQNVEDCLYLHDTRKFELSDHAGMLLLLKSGTDI